MPTRLSGIYGYQIVYPDDAHVWEFYPFATRPRDFSGLPYDLQNEPEARLSPGTAAQAIDSPLSPSPEVRNEFFKQYQTLPDKTRLPKEPDNAVTGEGTSAYSMKG